MNEVIVLQSQEELIEYIYKLYVNRSNFIKHLLKTFYPSWKLHKLMNMEYGYQKPYKCSITGRLVSTLEEEMQAIGKNEKKEVGYIVKESNLIICAAVKEALYTFIYDEIKKGNREVMHFTYQSYPQ